MASLFDANTFTTFDIAVSTTPPVTLHGHRSTDAHGKKPPLLLLHGFPQTHLIWHKVAPTLSQHFNLVIPDLRGYGGSSKPPAPSATDHSLYAKSALAADVSALMHALGHSSYSVVGHDRGGRVTHALCATRPAEVRRAMLLDICPTLAMYDATDKESATAYWHWFFLVQPRPFPEDAILAAPDVFANKTLGGLPRAGGRAVKDLFHPEAYAAYADLYRDPAGVHAMCEDYRAGWKEDCDEQRADLASGAHKIKCPIRVLWGKQGLIDKKFDAQKEWAKVCEPGMVDPNSASTDSGHYIPEEAPEELLRHIMEFFQGSSQDARL